MAQPLVQSDPRTSLQVAEYVRMSTDDQEYSPANQRAAIRHYARDHGMRVVRSYEDAGKSGLVLERREALQRLLADVQSGSAPYRAVLVLDVSRWGRFQNADEAAFYEYLCLRHGVRVIYVAEPFSDEGTPVSALVKSLKRSMAAEYSRELSTKVFAGQRRLLRLGFHMGGNPGYGLRRVLVDGQGCSKGVLERGQRKSISTDRIVLSLGPPEEVKVVRWMFRQSAAGRTNQQIVKRLNARHIPSGHPRGWTLTRVREMLDDERYIGTLIYARYSRAIGRQEGPSPDRVLRVPGAFPALVSPKLFQQAKAARAGRYRRLTNDELLQAMREVWQRHGRISSSLLGQDGLSPSVQVYLRRFGSLRAAYEQIGYTQSRDIAYADRRLRLRPWRVSILHHLIDLLTEDGSTVERDGWVLRIDGAWSLTVRLMQAGAYHGHYRWEVLPGRRRVDVVIAVRMPPDGSGPIDYLVLPQATRRHWPSWIDRWPTAAVRFHTVSSLVIVRNLARLSRQGASDVHP